MKKLIQRTPDPTDIREDDDPEQVAAKQMMAVMMASTRVRSITRASG